MAKTTTFYIKCSEEEAAAIRTVAKKHQRTVHNYLRVVVLADIVKTDASLLHQPLERESHASTEYPSFLSFEEARNMDAAYQHCMAGFDPITAALAALRANTAGTTPPGLQISQQLVDLQGADPNATVKSLTSMRDTLAARADAAVDGAAASSRPIDLSKPLPGEITI